MFSFSKNLVSLRKQHQKTQMDVATYIGVSKAAVSKWENDQSFPDIIILPKLATFFNTTIDRLLGYEPQMTKEHIQSLYAELANEFATKPFEEVFARIQAISKEYYSCFPLLVQLNALLLNYYHTSQQSQEEVLQFIESQFDRIESQCTELKLLQLSKFLRASLYSMTGRHEETLHILGEDVEPFVGRDNLLATTYMQLQQFEKAEETLQISLFQKLLSSISNLTTYLMIPQNNEKQFETLIQKANGLIDLFDLRALHFNTCAIFYMTAAMKYTQFGHKKQALDMLDQYRTLVEQLEFPIKLHGDAFFNLLDEWIVRELELGQSAPRDEHSIRQSILYTISKNGAFIPLHDDAAYHEIVKSLQFTLGVK